MNYTTGFSEGEEKEMGIWQGQDKKISLSDCTTITIEREESK